MGPARREISCLALTDADIDIVRNAWEQGFSYVSTKINVALQSHGVRIEVNPPPEEVYRLAVAIQRFCNAIILIRPYALDLPKDAELGPWPIGFISGPANYPFLVWRDCRNDEELDDLLAIVAGRDWNKAEFKECIEGASKFYSSMWRKFFNDLEERITSSSRDPVTVPTEISQQAWSSPMTRTEMARRITGTKKPRPRDVDVLLRQYGLRSAGGRKWQVRLDTMDGYTRGKIERPE